MEFKFYISHFIMGAGSIAATYFYDDLKQLAKQLIKKIMAKTDKKVEQFIEKNNVGEIFAKKQINNIDLNGKDLVDMGIEHKDDIFKIIKNQIPLSLDPAAEKYNAHKIAVWLGVEVKDLIGTIKKDEEPEAEQVPVKKNNLKAILQKQGNHLLNFTPNSYKAMGVTGKEDFDKLLNNKIEFSTKKGQPNYAQDMAAWLGVEVSELMDISIDAEGNITDKKPVKKNNLLDVLKKQRNDKMKFSNNTYLAMGVEDKDTFDKLKNNEIEFTDKQAQAMAKWLGVEVSDLIPE